MDTTKPANIHAKEVSAANWRSLTTLLVALILTIGLTWFTYNIVDEQEQREFVAAANEIGLKVDARLHAHVLILNAGNNYFHLSDTVTRDEWERFVEGLQIEKHLPGIQGVGYAVVIPPAQLDEHIRSIRQEGFPDYMVYPEADREVYTAIVYLEPFSGRNLRAFGYDMFSEPVRREAMLRACDYNMAALTGKVDLVQETGENIQAGTLMYMPVYEDDAVVNTVEQRRASLVGWVYSPFRMDDLMQGILGRWDAVDEPEESIHLQVFDDAVSTSSLLYDSQKNEPEIETIFPARVLQIPVEFNGTRWILHFKKSRSKIWYGEVILVLVGGVVISLLLYLLSLSYSRITFRSEKIRRQNEELQKINATKDKFFSIIAHDLKSPFNTIIGFSDILLKHVKQKNYSGTERIAEIISTSANNAMNLLMNLMEWSQSQTGRMRYHPREFDMVQLVNEIESLFKEAALQKSITIQNNLPEKALITADKAMIGTVLRNLISNALKYTDSGGKVIISVFEKTDEIVVSVSDTGIGMPKHQINKLFRIDENISTSGTQDEKGTGLGLILCKEFVDFHNGKIWVKSNQGEGSIFYFSIPRVIAGRKRSRRSKKLRHFPLF